MRARRTVSWALLCWIAAVPVALGEYTWESYNGHRYALTDHGTWAQAEAEAAGVGGHLATVDDAAENEWLAGVIADSYARGRYGQSHQNGAWIGYESVGGNWQWVSGSPVTYTNYASNWPTDDGVHTYLLGDNYDAGPSGSLPGQWGHNDEHDVQYVANLQGIIEVPWDHDWHTYNGHRYALTEHGTWAEAEAEAIAVGGHLATINDAAESAWLEDFIADCYSRDYYGVPHHNGAWIGYQQDGGTWEWASGEPVTYVNYATEWSSDSGVHGYLLGSAYDAGPGGPFSGEWGHNDEHDDLYGRNLRAVIEVIPEPATLSLLPFGAVLLARRRART